MRVGQPLVDFRDRVDREDFAVRRAGELVGAMAGADRNGERIDAGLFDEIEGLLGIGQKFLARQLAFEAVTVFLFAGPGFEVAETAKLAFDRYAGRMGDLCLLYTSPSPRD